jgi:hypothetical protein
MRSDSTDWWLLVVSLPTQAATARMRIWRALKSQGCAALRDGAYLLPGGGGRGAALRELADDCVREGGTAWLMAVQAGTPEDEAAYRALFDRSDDLAEQRKAWKQARSRLAKLPTAELLRVQRRLQRDYEALKAIDYFPGDSSAETEAAWLEFNRRLQALASPDEPHEAAGELPRLDVVAYRGRTWATRRRLWVDRVACAWLIRRFIDPQARFLWLAQPADCPPEALGFDFDGATFTHVGERVSFETLLVSFGLEEDAALVRLGAMVRQLDVGGPPVPEAAGFEAMLSGARGRLPDDDALLAEVGHVLDSLYAHFGRPKA